jgi:predicted Zn-dependent protease
MEAFFASHPVEESRIEATQAEIRKLDPALLPSLTRDTPAFRAFKTRLQALPRRTPAR